MTISFDAIWIPLTISGLGVLWAAFVLREEPGNATAMLGWTAVLLIGVALPLVPSLVAWLVWALLA